MKDDLAKSARYFITGFEKIDKNCGTGGSSRCFGFRETFEQADEAVKENCCDIWETCYNYAVIEKIYPGIHSIALERWFYKFNTEKMIYEPIPEPEEMKHFCNFSIG